MRGFQCRRATGNQRLMSLDHDSYLILHAQHAYGGVDVVTTCHSHMIFKWFLNLILLGETLHAPLADQTRGQRWD
jgi:hypothetical protein